MQGESLCGLFVGLTTLDLIYRAQQPPTSNQKLVASDYTVAAGGPATNAAVAFSYLGGQARILSAVGRHPMTHLIQADFKQTQVEVWDLTPQREESPPVSSIIVTKGTGERAVISINAVRSQVTEAAIPPDCLQGVDIVLIDGHQMAVGRAIAQQARALSIPVVVDGGSWKPNFRTVLTLTDYAICSANFYPPGCKTWKAVVAYLTGLGVPYIALTNGSKPIYYRSSQAESGQVEVPKIQPIDTLGAGDIFHGAFCYFILQQGFVEALANAAKVAAIACQSFGTRRWLKKGEAKS
jgi:sugar/nucleoside kinase (ribokinase family)